MLSSVLFLKNTDSDIVKIVRKPLFKAIEIGACNRGESLDSSPNTPRTSGNL